MIEQRTPEWYAAREGFITASRMHDVMALGEGGVFASGPRKGQPRPVGAARLAYIDQLVCDHVMIESRERRRLQAAALDHGITYEPEAIAAYERQAGVLVMPAGLMIHPAHHFIRASPDFLQGDDTGGEVKCPFSPLVHMQTLREGLPSAHIEQIQGGMFVTGLKRWIFISYHPDFKPGLQLYVQTILRDDVYISQLESACVSLWAEVQAGVAKLSRRIRA